MFDENSVGLCLKIHSHRALTFASNKNLWVLQPEVIFK